MNADLATLLFYPLASSLEGQTLLLDGAGVCALPDGFGGDIYCPHKMHVSAYRQALLHGETDIQAGTYEIVCIALPKNMVEARYFMALALRAAAQGALICAAAMNDAGGNRIAKMMAEFGLSGVQSYSKHKGRVCWSRLDSADQTALDQAMTAGAPQLCEGTGFYSQPGVFGWDKIDAGSALLLDCLPEGLKGKGADFGCGYGYLSAALLKRFAAISLIAIDEDARAIAACAQNAPQAEMLWADIAQDDLPQRLDFIVMNPPFHQGKGQDIALGQRFIARAAQSLKKKGVLYMVANAHLPYEGVLAQHFFACEKLHEGQGFKVYKAVL